MRGEKSVTGEVLFRKWHKQWKSLNHKIAHIFGENPTRNEKGAKF